MQTQQQPGHKLLAEVCWWVGGDVHMRFAVPEAPGHVLDWDSWVGCGFLGLVALAIGLGQLWGLHPDSWIGLQRKPPVEQCYLLFVKVERLNLPGVGQKDVKSHTFKVWWWGCPPPEACQGALLRPETGCEPVFQPVEGSLQGFLGFGCGFGCAEDSAASPVTYLPSPPGYGWAVEQVSGEVAAQLGDFPGAGDLLPKGFGLLAGECA